MSSIIQAVSDMPEEVKAMMLMTVGLLGVMFYSVEYDYRCRKSGRKKVKDAYSIC